MKVIIAIVVLVVIGAIALFAMSSSTVLSISPEVKVVGVTTPVTVKIANPHGVRRVAAYLEQGGTRYPLTEVKTASHRLVWRRNQAPQTLTFEAGKSKAPNLKEGDARLIVEADSDDLAGHTDTVSSSVKVILAAPRVAPDDAQHYINQGGMELAVMTPSGSWTESGVKVGKYNFRSFPLPGRPEQRFAMFAYPWDLAENVTPMVFARNPAGTEATAQFWFKLFPKKFRVRDFPIDDALMTKLVNQIDPNGTLAPGPDVLSRFLKINGEMRRKNNQQLADLRLKTEEKVLWNGPFLHWGKEESMFADVRNYIYKGKKVDQQVHLGLRPLRYGKRACACGERRTGGVGRRSGDLRQLRGGGPRVRAAIDLRPHESLRCEGGRHGEEESESRRGGGYGPRGRRPCSLQHAGGWRTGKSARVVGRALDSRSNHEQAGSERRRRRRVRRRRKRR